MAEKCEAPATNGDGEVIKEREKGLQRESYQRNLCFYRGGLDYSKWYSVGHCATGGYSLYRGTGNLEKLFRAYPCGGNSRGADCDPEPRGVQSSLELAPGSKNL